ncbi:hypothetical protein [Methylobacterium sp. D48H]
MSHVTEEKAADGHFMVKVAGRAVTEICEKRQARKLVRAMRICRAASSRCSAEDEARRCDG